MGNGTSIRGQPDIPASLPHQRAKKTSSPGELRGPDGESVVVSKGGPSLQPAQKVLQKPVSRKPVAPLKPLPLLPVEEQIIPRKSLKDLTLGQLEKLGDKLALAYRTERSAFSRDATKLETLRENLDLIREIRAGKLGDEGTPFQNACKFARTLAYDYEEKTKLGFSSEKKMQIQERSWISGLIGFEGLSGRSEEAKEVALNLINDLSNGSLTPEQKEEAKTIFALLKESEWFQAVLEQHHEVRVEFQAARGTILSKKEVLLDEVNRVKKMVDAFVQVEQRNFFGSSRVEARRNMGLEEVPASTGKASREGLQRFILHAMSVVALMQDDLDSLSDLTLSLWKLKKSPRFKSVCKNNDLEKQFTQLQNYAETMMRMKGIKILMQQNPNAPGNLSALMELKDSKEFQNACANHPDVRALFTRLEKQCSLLQSGVQRVATVHDVDTLVSLKEEIEDLSADFTEQKENLLRLVKDRMVTLLSEPNTLLNIDGADLKNKLLDRAFDQLQTLREQAKKFEDERLEPLLQAHQEKISKKEQELFQRERGDVSAQIEGFTKQEQVFSQKVVISQRFLSIKGKGEAPRWMQTRPLESAPLTNENIHENIEKLEQLQRRLSSLKARADRFSLPEEREFFSSQEATVGSILQQFYILETRFGVSTLAGGQEDKVRAYFEGLSFRSLAESKPAQEPLLSVWKQEMAQRPRETMVWTRGRPEKEELYALCAKTFIESSPESNEQLGLLLQDLTNSERKEFYSTFKTPPLELKHHIENAFQTENIRRSLLIGMSAAFCEEEISKEPIEENKQAIRDTAKYTSLALSAYTDGNFAKIANVLKEIVANYPPPSLSEMKAFIKTWVENHKGDINFTPQLKAEVLGLVGIVPEEEVEASTSVPESGSMEKLLEKGSSLEGAERKKAAKEVASEINAVTTSLFLQWNPTYLATTKKIEEGGFEVVDFVNSLGHCVTHDILFPAKDAKEALKRVAFWMDVLEECIDKGNLHAAMVIYASLNNSNLAHLIKEDAALSRRNEAFGKWTDASRQSLDFFSASGSYKGARAYIEMRKEEGVIPYLGMSFTDSTFIKDGNSEIGGFSARVPLLGKSIAELREHQTKVAQRHIPSPRTDLHAWVTKTKSEIQGEASAELERRKVETASKTPNKILDDYFYYRAQEVRGKSPVSGGT